MNIDTHNIFTWILGLFGSLIAIFVSMVDTVHEFKDTNERLGKLEVQTQSLIESQQRIEDHLLR